MIEINKNYNEDCLQTMKRMPDNFIHLTVTSPPYDNLRKYNGYHFDFESIAKELYRVTKQGGIVAWIVGDATIKGSETGTSFRQALYFMGIGFRLHDTMIYNKVGYIPLTHRRYEQAFEYMMIFSKGRPSVFNPMKIPCKTPGKKYKMNGVKSIDPKTSIRARQQVITVKDSKIKGNVWAFHLGNNDKTKHPAPFPEQLCGDHIISWTNKGDLVYDPFMGSGTTAKMAIINGRNWIGSEISTEYCQIIQERIKNTNQ